MKNTSASKANKVNLTWVAVVTGLLLLIPLVAIQFSEEVDWGVEDFVVMGLLIFGIGTSYEMLARKVKKENRIFVALALGALFLYLWAELAVGIFTNLGS